MVILFIGKKTNKIKCKPELTCDSSGIESCAPHSLAVVLKLSVDSRCPGRVPVVCSVQALPGTSQLLKLKFRFINSIYSYRATLPANSKG